MAPFVCLRLGQADSSELVAEADHVDEGVDVYVDFCANAEDCVVDISFGVDVDIAKLGVKHDVIGQHVIHADLSGPAPRVLHAEIVKPASACGATNAFIEELCVIDPRADIRLESRFIVQRVINQAQCWR